MDVRVGLWRKLRTKELMLLNCGVGEDSWESLGLQGDPTSSSWRKSVLGVHWKDWCCSWNSNTLATWCEELTHWKRPWCWEGLGAGGEGDDRRWDGWIASPTRWTWVWVNSGSWWWTGRPGVLRFMGLHRVRHDWVTELKQRRLYTKQCMQTWVSVLFFSLLIYFYYKFFRVKYAIYVYMHANSLQSCPTLWDAMDHSPPGSSVHWILQARILEWVAVPSSMWSSWPWNQTLVAYISSVGRSVLNH